MKELLTASKRPTVKFMKEHQSQLVQHNLKFLPSDLQDISTGTLCGKTITEEGLEKNLIKCYGSICAKTSTGCFTHPSTFAMGHLHTRSFGSKTQTLFSTTLHDCVVPENFKGEGEGECMNLHSL